MKALLILGLCCLATTVFGSPKGMDELSLLYGERALRVRDHVLGKMEVSVGPKVSPWKGLTPRQREFALTKIEHHLIYFKLLDRLSQAGDNLYFDYHPQIPGFRSAWEQLTKEDWSEFDPADFASSVATTQEEEFRFHLAERFWVLTQNEQLETVVTLMELSSMAATPTSQEKEPATRKAP